MAVVHYQSWRTCSIVKVRASCGIDSSQGAESPGHFGEAEGIKLRIPESLVTKWIPGQRQP
ncbi:hypothetical protein ACRRTK_003923 [Alexandromys fortis]